MSLLLGFAEYREQAMALARGAGWDYGEVAVHRFPDEECRVRVPAPLPPAVALCRPLDHPDPKLVELLLAAAACRDQGVRELTLVAPYLCYMRQDKAFHPGEAVSQRVVGGLLAGAFDALITVDPHLHRVHRLAEAVPVERASALSAAPLLGALAAGRCRDPVLVGPDAESEQWVRQAAEPRGLEWMVGRKERRGDLEVVVRLPARDLRGRELVLLDDVASSGRTLEQAALALAGRGAASLSVAVTHALFVGDAMARLRAAGVGGIWSTDAVPHPTNAVPLAPLLAPVLAAT